MAKKDAKLQEVNYQEVEGRKKEESIVPHTHNGIDSPLIDGQNKKKLGILSHFQSVIQAASLSVADSAFSRLNFNSEVFDPVDMHSNQVNPSRLTIQEGGVYRILAHARWTDNTTGDRGIALYVNGTQLYYAFDRPDATGRATHNFFQVLNLEKGNYLELFAYQSSGGALVLLRVQLQAELLGYV